jgi:probable rRNA maturation factor
LRLAGSVVELTLCDDRFMRTINRRFMHKTGPTDVLSFPQIPPRKRPGDPRVYRGRFLGDILISLDQAGRQAARQGIALTHEVEFLIIHAILHLIGHDHAMPAERLRMQALECRLWQLISG